LRNVQLETKLQLSSRYGSDRSERKRAEGRGLHQIGSRFQGMHIVAAARIAGIARENIGRVE
jgi:hypothetical protein